MHALGDGDGTEAEVAGLALGEGAGIGAGDGCAAVEGHGHGDVADGLLAEVGDAYHYLHGVAGLGLAHGSDEDCHAGVGIYAALQGHRERAGRLGAAVHGRHAICIRSREQRGPRGIGQCGVLDRRCGDAGPVGVGALAAVYIVLAGGGVGVGHDGHRGAGHAAVGRDKPGVVDVGGVAALGPFDGVDARGVAVVDGAQGLVGGAQAVDADEIALAPAQLYRSVKLGHGPASLGLDLRGVENLLAYQGMLGHGAAPYLGGEGALFGLDVGAHSAHGGAGHLLGGDALGREVVGGIEVVGCAV